MSAAGLVLGFHGCDEKVAERILAGKEHVSISENTHDWLGTGAYFWENSPLRAFQWAQIVHGHPQHFRHCIRKPSVVGAIIETGNSLDLTQSESLLFVKEAWKNLKDACQISGAPLPVYEPGFSGDLDLVKRHLDCAVINIAHVAREARGF